MRSVVANLIAADATRDKQLWVVSNEPQEKVEETKILSVHSSRCNDYLHTLALSNKYRKK